MIDSHKKLENKDWFLDPDLDLALQWNPRENFWRGDIVSSLSLVNFWGLQGLLMKPPIHGLWVGSHPLLLNRRLLQTVGAPREAKTLRTTPTYGLWYTHGSWVPVHRSYNFWQLFGPSLGSFLRPLGVSSGQYLDV